ncbi:hypothetical protein O3M35_005499 [Rhynocoris fuscipes]|uniref:Solute carrier family 66 member 3 n=1 Tax=Rhynocoris fuscipes TaxID=488301 RepID=A0AAW1DJR8_9HEMI
MGKLKLLFCFTAQCNKILLTKILGLTIILLSLIVKLPQINKIWINQSAKSVNIFSVLANLYSVTIKGSYCFLQSFPISAYGEQIVIGCQNIILTVLVLHYNMSTKVSTAFVGLYSAILYILVNDFIPFQLLMYFQILTGPVNFVGRMIQAYTIYRDKSTGQLSGYTYSIQFFMAASRIFTSIEETKDLILICNYSLSTFSLALILVLFLYYNKNNKSKVN